MSQGIQELQQKQLTQALEEILLPQLQEIICSRNDGHCMRVADLDLELMIVLTRSLRRELPEAQIFILESNDQVNEEPDLYISSTKLVELRNPLQDGSLRSPLLVFLPSNLQTNAEDSFNVASFEEISVTNVYQELIQSLIQRVPISLQGYVKDIFSDLTQEKWRWANTLAQARFLLTAIENEISGDTLGGALYELGLVPDFKLFAEPENSKLRIRKNLESMQKLTLNLDKSILGRVFDLELDDKSVQNQLIKFLLERGVEEPRRWTKEIVLENNNWHISFDKWKFKEDYNKDKIFIEVINTELPVIQEDEKDERRQSLVGQQILDPKNLRKFKIEFEVNPLPKQVQGLEYFTVQIYTQDGGAVGVAKKVKARKTKNPVKSVNLDKLDKFDFEEGWHYVRVLPWTANNDPIPLEADNKSTTTTQTNTHDSELFYVLPDSGEINDEEPPQRAIPQENSLQHAKLKLQFTAISQERDPKDITLKDVVWADRSTKTRTTSQESLEVKFKRDGKFRILVSQCLKDLEQQILASPKKPAIWKLQINMGQVESPIEDIIDFPNSQIASTFLSARASYFNAIRSGNKNLISQAVDFTSLKEICYQYAAAYRELLIELRGKTDKNEDPQALKDLKNLLSLDTVRLSVKDFRGQTVEAILVGPTHPLRALWLSTWSQIGQHWVNTTQEGFLEYISPVRDSILQGLVPLNIPATLPLIDGKVFITVDNINPFWSLYAPSTAENTRGLLGEVCTALGLPEPTIGANVNAQLLASRIERYLAQNSYIRTLSINAFNPGRATVLAEALILLQKREAFKDLRYNIRLFVPDPEAPGVGEAIEQLLVPVSSITSEVVDAFSTSSGNYLFPKLNVAVHSIDDFRTSENSYQAHISILIDLFPAREIAVGVPFHQKDIAPLHGLIQDFSIEFQDDENGTFWRRQPRHGKALPVDEIEDSINLLAELPQLISGATATIATGLPAFEKRPIVTLGLNAQQRELLHRIHNICDWVFTIDRNIGIEFFDRGSQSKRPPYLVDYIPNATSSFGHRLMITSRSLSELESFLLQILERYQLKAEPKRAEVILEQLRSLSGRLALKLISSTNEQAEALGLALARLFLKYQGALSNQIILPLDAHLELFKSAKQQADALGNSISLQRTDLALFDLNTATRTIVCNLVEVKCYSKVGNTSAFNSLKEKITEQIDESQKVLSLHFEPKERPDKLLKIRELATLLEFYLDRALRYGAIEKEAAEEARICITTLEEGYTLEFTRSGLIFDFEKPGTEAPDNEQGIEFHRIGIDLIKTLVEYAKPITNISTIEPEEITEEEIKEIKEVENSIPRLTSAAFIVEPRERSITDNFNSDKKIEETENNTTIIPEQTDNNKALEEEIQQEKEELSDTQCNEIIANEIEENVLTSASKIEIENQPEIPLTYDTILGVKFPTPQYGILGEMSGRKIALDLNQTHTISLFGVQGAGKSYTLGTVVEMACMQIPNINTLPSPLATVIFHYSPTQDYKPEFTSMVAPNSESNQIDILQKNFGAKPTQLKDIVILVPASKVEERKLEYQNIEVLPLTFAASELNATHWKFLMGAVGSQSMYLRQINQIIKKLRNQLTLEKLIQGLEKSSLSEQLKDLARTRLEFAAEYIDDSRRLSDIVRPGRLVIIDLRDEFIEKDEALGLFVVLLQIFSEATYNGEKFNKLVVFDEAHKYMESSDLVVGLTEVVREMRHKGTSIMLASQDPPSVPTSLIELSSQIIMHRFNSPAWLKHIQKANTALNSLTPEKMSNLDSGEAYIWSNKANDESFTKGAVKIRCRPRVTQHGGSTKTAVT